MNQLHLIATFLFSLIMGANAWSYKEANNWGKQYSTCNGKHQSPVIIKSLSEMNFSRINEELRLTNFNKLPEKLTIKNTGRTVEIKVKWSGKPPRLTGGPLHGNYVFEKTTFHWAQKAWSDDVTKPDPNVKGPYLEDMEMHVFFYRRDLKSFEKAQSQKNGLAVFKMLLKTGYDIPEHMFDGLEKSLNKVQSIDKTAEIPPFRLLSILDHLPPFEFYEGSLDYPPCYESATWFVYGADVPITDNLLKEFRKIKLAEGDVSNVRPIQALNKRPIKDVYNREGFQNN